VAGSYALIGLLLSWQLTEPKESSEDE
jgi:hypothetical protein